LLNALPTLCLCDAPDWLVAVVAGDKAIVHVLTTFAPAFAYAATTIRADTAIRSLQRPGRHRQHMLTRRAPSTNVDAMLNAKSLPSPTEPAEALAAVVALRLMADRLERKAVDAALAQGWSWSQIAEALGISKQAAHRRLSEK
jgi:DNA-directed RNA polymerase specialized sigma24 family protein